MIKPCPRCETSHSKPGIYCSRTCANSRTFSVETKKKKSDSNKNYFQSLTDEEKSRILTRLESTKLNRQGEVAPKLFEKCFDELSYQSKRKRVFIEQDFSCHCCKLSEWLGMPLTLELEHIDGDNTNDSRQNLIGLCPNCHSLTSTWRGKKNSKDYKDTGVASAIGELKDYWHKYKELGR